MALPRSIPGRFLSLISSKQEVTHQIKESVGNHFFTDFILSFAKKLLILPRPKNNRIKKGYATVDTPYYIMCRPSLDDRLYGLHKFFEGKG